MSIADGKENFDPSNQDQICSQFNITKYDKAELI